MLVFFYNREEMAVQMEEKIQSLYEEINFIGFYCMYHKENHYIEKTAELFPDIQEFAQWFLSGNQFGIEDDLYHALQKSLIEVLKDCEEALRERDRVLMMDALEQGISEYLKMFLSEEYLKEKENENIRREDS